MLIVSSSPLSFFRHRNRVIIKPSRFRPAGLFCGVQYMNPHLAILIELQQLDSTIRALDTEIKSLPQKIAEIESTLAAHIQKVESDKKRVAENQLGRRKRETEIASLREKISRHRDQMLEVKTNEQYKALLHEIEFHESAIRRLEDEILSEMIESEAIEKELRQAEKSLAEEHLRAKGEVEEAHSRQQQDDEKLKVTQSQRAQSQSALPSDVLETYELILAVRRGIAVTPVHNGTCSACHVRLRPQAYNDAQTNATLLQCESCSCILYYVPPPPQENPQP